ncbi:zinc ribbon domain-containing protein [Candidatus Enterococcus leclercqii]|uniref:zinc ribbon domain-containing protein n=1 Tax=Candidatus Enterococcus leclercqii TaxID=1857218 RepID=UPI00137ADB6E|nr:zinc ribbon domain-containing protein [Enterococcus sp. CU9D]KAF1294174.1 hypothetical protein BAU14_07235 [Enterococcus sp. CU9D]
MKFCVNCGKEIEENAKFCTFCGTIQPEINEGVQKNSHQVDPILAQHSVQQSTESQTRSAGAKLDELASNETVQEIKKSSINYFSFLNNNIISPKIGDENPSSIFGLVNYIFISLINGLAVSRVLSNIIGNYNDSVFVFFLEFILWVAVALLVYPLTHFIFEKVIYKQNISLLDSFSRIFAPASLSVYTSAATLLLAFLVSNTLELFLLLFVVSFGLVGYAFAGSLWTGQIVSMKKPNFYIVVLAFVASAVLLYFVFRIFTGVLIDKMDTLTGFNYIFNLFDR